MASYEAWRFMEVPQVPWHLHWTMLSSSGFSSSPQLCSTTCWVCHRISTITTLGAVPTPAGSSESWTWCSLYAVVRVIMSYMSVTKCHNPTRWDRWFLYQGVCFEMNIPNLAQHAWSSFPAECLFLSPCLRAAAAAPCFQPLPKICSPLLDWRTSTTCGSVDAVHHHLKSPAPHQSVAQAGARKLRVWSGAQLYA